MWEGINRRRFPRASYRCLVTLRGRGVPKTFTTQTENIGVGGVCVILEERLDIFEEVDLTLTLLNGSAPVKCGGTVVWTVKRAEFKKPKAHMYDTGIEFKDIKSEDRERLEKIVKGILEKGK